MLKLFTTVGIYNISVDANGNKTIVVVAGGKENILGLEESVIWSCLLWEVLTYDELQNCFNCKLARERIVPQMGFDECLQRLEQRGLIASGCDVVGIDAAYDLLADLYIVPISDSLPRRTYAFFIMMLNRVPISRAFNVLLPPKLTDGERRLLKMARKETKQNGAPRVSSLIVEASKKVVGGFGFDTQAGAISAQTNDKRSTRFAAAQCTVIELIGSLYMKEMLLFEKSI